MELECAQDIGHKNVTEAQLREAFRDDRGRGEYIILFRDNTGRKCKHFIQAWGECDDPYWMEYQEGGKEQFFHAAGKYTKAQVEQAFVWYLNNDNRWRTTYPWEKNGNQTLVEILVSR